MSVVASNARPTPRVTRRRRTSGRCRCGGDAALKLSVRTCRARLVVVGPCPEKRRSARERAISLGAHPWCDVSAVASNAERALRVACDATRSTPALAVAGEETQHARLLCARAVPRWLWSARALFKCTASAKCFSPSARTRGATCQLRPSTPSQRRVSRGADAPALAVTGKEAQHAGLLCARAVPR